jgi:hypothetical protein
MVDTPKSIFAHNLEMSRSIQPIWQRLIIFAAIVLVLDITVRRIKISNQDIVKGWDWMKSASRIGRTAPQTGPKPASQLSTLLEIKKQKQRREQTISLDRTRPIVVPSEPVISKKSMQNHPKGELSISTAELLLAKKRERERGENR